MKVRYNQRQRADICVAAYKRGTARALAAACRHCAHPINHERNDLFVAKLADLGIDADNYTPICNGCIRTALSMVAEIQGAA